jgi:hypothetical protein
MPSIPARTSGRLSVGADSPCICRAHARQYIDSRLHCERLQWFRQHVWRSSRQHQAGDFASAGVTE